MYFNCTAASGDRQMVILTWNQNPTLILVHARPSHYSVCASFLHYILVSATVLVKSKSCVCVCVSHSVVSDSLQPHGLWPTKLLCPWNSPGNNTGVGCHDLPNPGSEPRSSARQADSLPFELPGKSKPRSPQANPSQNEWKTNVTEELLWKGGKPQWWDSRRL